MTRNLLLILATPLLAAVLADSSSAQMRMTSPMASPAASTSQMVGLTQVSVTYGRPGLNGRDVLHDPQVIPVDNAELPWRAGANENTVVSFDHDVSIEGQPLAAGSYGLHIYPKSSGPWTVIFSNNIGAWGSYSYNQAEDALRVNITPGEGPQRERLTFDFEDLTNTGATLVLAWDSLRLPITISADTNAHMVSYLHNEYTRGYGFWIPAQLNQAAAWCDSNDLNLEEALTWATRGSGGAPTFASLMVKASIQEKLGQDEAATASHAAAAPMATETQLNNMGYQALSAGKLDQAIKFFSQSLVMFPNSWNAHDSLGEAFAKDGQTDRAIELYTKAREMAPDDTNRQRIDAVLAGLRG